MADSTCKMAGRIRGRRSGRARAIWAAPTMALAALIMLAPPTYNPPYTTFFNVTASSAGAIVCDQVRVEEGGDFVVRIDTGQRGEDALDVPADDLAVRAQ